MAAAECDELRPVPHQNPAHRQRYHPGARIVPRPPDAVHRTPKFSRDLPLRDPEQCPRGFQLAA
jgi:hypothetical protein